MQFEELEKVKLLLNEEKSKADRGSDMNAWSKHTTKSNPANLVQPRIKSYVQPELLSQVDIALLSISYICIVLPGGR